MHSLAIFQTCLPGLFSQLLSSRGFPEATHGKSKFYPAVSISSRALLFSIQHIITPLGANAIRHEHQLPALETSRVKLKLPYFHAIPLYSSFSQYLSRFFIFMSSSNSLNFLNSDLLPTTFVAN